MSILSPTFALGLVLLIYLVSFVIFAILRIATGISIQRIGYFSLRRIAYTFRDGIRIDLRGLGLVLHRPTFAQPTWISLRLRELKVTVNFTTLGQGHDSSHPSKGVPAKASETTSCIETSSARTPKPNLRRSLSQPSRSQTWKRLTELKEKLKRLHGRIRWIRLVDVEVLNASLVIIDVGTFEIGTLSMAVDTRRKTVDRGRLFQHKKVPAGDQQPVEWIFTLKSVLFNPVERESLEVLDVCNLNIHGLLYKNPAGLRDSSISLKLGRIRIPYDDLLHCRNKIELLRNISNTGKNIERENIERDNIERDNISVTEVIQELDRPGSREAKIVQTVSDSKEFVSSILRGIQEIQMAVSFIGMTKIVDTSTLSSSPLNLNVAMNEFGIDLYRLDSKGPAHRMYFSPQDIAHQALLAGISIGLSLDDGKGKPERILYVPMATMTIKTTLPSKTVAFSEEQNAAERNANILFANLVLTSPSVDVDPKHMALVLALAGRRPDVREKVSTAEGRRHHLISRLLPKAIIKVSVHEPVLRVVLPPADLKLTSSDDYDLLICSISSISLDVESSHSLGGEQQYALTSNLRVSSNQLYYQTACGDRYDLLITDTLELKLQINATPEVSVAASGNLQTFSVHIVRPEISAGVYQIVQQLSEKTEFISSSTRKSKETRNFLRPLPSWLIHFQFQGSNFGIDVAGMDANVSKDIRGVSLQLESWTAEYKVQKDTEGTRPPSRRRARARSSLTDDPLFKITPPAEDSEPVIRSTDGRRLAVHVRGLEGFVIEGTEAAEPESLVSLPRFEVAFYTSSDSRGPIFHMNSHIRQFYMQYSLYRYYAIGVAFTVLRKAFLHRKHHASAEALRQQPDLIVAELTEQPLALTGRELISLEVKVELLQIKATMPSDPPLLLQIFGLEAGSHRWTAPFLKSRLLRLYAEAPRMKSSWARIVTAKNLRVDWRASRRKTGKTVINEKSIDIATEFIRLGVPHQLILHKIFDNFANVFKATEQLHHRFMTGTDEYILKKQPERPKMVPKISIRSKALQFELEDGPFEWKLGSIYRTGLLEQKQRLARLEAYMAKVKNLEDLQNHRASSRFRTHSSRPPRRGTSHYPASRSIQGQTETSDEGIRGRSSSLLGSRAGHFRYDPEGKCRLTGLAKISAEEAWNKLQRYNAQSWKKRIDYIYKIQSTGMRDIRSLFWGNDEIPDIDTSEKILAMPERPGLMSTIISDLHILIDKPSFPINECAQFLHKAGKGMPHRMQYTLLIPLNIQINMGEARITLRDYPLPLIHVPAIRPGQPSRLPSWSLKTDFVIAEEFRNDISTKKVKVEVIPPGKFTNTSVPGGFAVDVRRTVSPVKTYSDVQIAINTSAPTSITWGTSYQPAIQDMMMIIEGFTKPQIDPSDRIGFWDKIRLGVHSRVHVAWKGDGDVHLKLKGSRDPYVVTGHGAGFVMCWRNNVNWAIHQKDDPKEFMTVTSGEYVLAIPDYSHEARETDSSGRDGESITSSNSFKSGAIFKKVIMKLSGNVRWMAGIVFERDLGNGKRSFESLPHYEVTLRTPEHAKAHQSQITRSNSSSSKVYDAFEGFRSQYIHLSIAVAAPLDREWASPDLNQSPSYNTVHLTPRFFTHFFDWWSLFSGAMSLPVRQGKLFPGLEKASKKFGRHLATIKYNLLLSPLFIAHMYKHKDVEDYAEALLSATGLKLRLDKFMLDLHQRREEFTGEGKDRGKQIITTGMRIHEVQLDFVSADVRAVSASIAGTSAEALKTATDEDLASYQEPALSDMSRFTIPDNDFSWIDMDDFVELDWILPAETNPATKIMPLAYAPRFTYFRQTDHIGKIPKQENSCSPFGHEPTHFCVMSQDNDPRKVQCGLIQERISTINEQLEMHKRTVGEQELRLVRDGNRDGSLKDRFQLLSSQGAVLENKRRYLKNLLARLTARLDENKTTMSSDNDAAVPDLASGNSSDYEPGQDEIDIEAAPITGLMNDFDNRFIVHNLQLKWNNSLRNIILRYVHQVSQRRGFVYYMSRRAIKFILDIVEEQKKNKQGERQSSNVDSSDSDQRPKVPLGPEEKQDSKIEDLVQQLLHDVKKTVDANDPTDAEAIQNGNKSDVNEDISQEYTPVNSYHVRLIAPQIQLQSEQHAKSVLLVTAKSMQLTVIQIMDKDRMTDDVSGLVQRRFSVDMDSVQFFVTNQKNLTQFLHLYSGNRYGTPKGSAWPPWVPFEFNSDFKENPFGWARVVQKTSASLRYEKYNTLRLKLNDEINSGKNQLHVPANVESRIDHILVDFPQIRAICDSAQYYTMYVIVTDLLLYNEPLEKVRSERLEKIMLASDFSDLRGAPEMVTSLQGRIRQLDEIKMYFQIHAKYLDRQGWQDRLLIEQDLASYEDELFFMMKALSTSQRKNDDRGQASQKIGLLRWYLSASEIVWHLMKAENEPLIEIQLKNAAYERTDNSDGSNYNNTEVERIRGLNLLPDAVYPEMIAPFLEHGKPLADGKMLRVQWRMLEAIAGIPVLDQFEVMLFPLKIQLEREVGKQLFEYIFPGAGSNAENGNLSPFMVKYPPLQDEGDEDSDETQPSTSPYEGGSTDSSHPYTRPASLELRLRPTKGFLESHKSRSSNATANGESLKPRSSGGTTNGETHHFRLFQHSNHSTPSSSPLLSQGPSKKLSRESLRSYNRSSHDTSSTSLSAMNAGSERSKKFTLNRSVSRDGTREKEKAKKTSDELTEMLSRASNYMTLAYVRIPSVVLCLSYKGRSERNIEDVHDFVFRMPALEYRNKTWSNLDLALRLKKDVIKALISHTGAIIGNKFSHHRPPKQQQSRLRELANSSAMLASNNSTVNIMRDPDAVAYRAELPSGSSLSTGESQPSRTNSFGSSGRSSGLPNGLSISNAPSIPESPAEATDDHQSHSFMRNTFTRRFTNESVKARQRDSAAVDDAEETSRKKSVLLLGKKFLGSLN